MSRAKAKFLVVFIAAYLVFTVLQLLSGCTYVDPKSEVSVAQQPPKKNPQPESLQKTLDDFFQPRD